MSLQEIQRRDEEVRRQAYERGLEDARAGLPEDPEPATLLGPHEGHRYAIVWNAYVEGRVDGGAELPF